MSKKVEVFGREFKSMTEACNYYGVKSATVSARMKKGMSLEDALVSKSVPKNRPKKPVVFKGIEFECEDDLYKFYGVSRNTVSYRMKKKGMSFEEALTHSGNITTGQKVTINNKEFDSIAEACRFYDLNYNSVMKRINRGSSIEEAILTPVHTRAILDINGVKYNNLDEISHKYNIPRNKLSNLIYNEGMSAEEAVGVLVEEYIIVFEGKEFTSVAEVCNHYGVNKNMVYSRLSCGWSLVDAIKSPSGYPNSIPVVIDGVEFRTIKEACKYNNVSYGMVMSRIYEKGMPVEEAIKTPKIPSNRISVSVLGKDFISIKHACLYHEVKYSMVKYHMKERGISAEEAIIFVKSK